MINGPYVIAIPIEGILEFHDLAGRIIGDGRIEVGDWPHLRQNVSEGDEVVLVSGVPEDWQAVCLHAIVVRIDDETRAIEVVI